ncbi:MAG TPA: hypothetical protein V6C81_09760 [Planktothrix sp.]
MRGYTSVALFVMLSSFATGLLVPFIWVSPARHEAIKPPPVSRPTPLPPTEPLQPTDFYEPHAWARDKYDPHFQADDDEGVVMNADLGAFQRKLKASNRRIRRGRGTSAEYAHRAWLLITLDDLPGAIASATKAIRKNPKNEKAYEARGYAYDRLGNEKLADRDYAHADR